MVTIPRKAGESVVINDDITLTVLEIRGDKVRFEIQCPGDVTVHCNEVLDPIQRAECLPSFKTGFSG